MGRFSLFDRRMTGAFVTGGLSAPLIVHSMKKAKRITNSAATIQVAA